MNLIELAKKSIEAVLDKRKIEVDEKTKQKYNERKACFVTLTLDKELRGCVGSLEPRQELWKDVVENSVNAAFHDFRFYPLSKEEFNKINIEISVLTIPKKIQYKDVEDLKKKIFKKGVIIKKDFYSATYLPQVWEQLPKEEDFLNSLCLKAGLNSSAWKKQKLEVWIYDVKKMK